MQSAITVRHATLVSPDCASRRSLFVNQGRIAAQVSPAAWALDLRDHLIFPGLINAHDHLQLNNIPRLPEHAPFPNSYAWMVAFQPYFREPAVAQACNVPADARLWQGGLKNLLCGATTVAHHDPWQPLLDDPAFPVRLLRRFGWSHSLGLGMEMRDWRLETGMATQSPISHLQSLPHYGPPVAESYAATPIDWPWIMHLAEGTDQIAAAELAQLTQLGCLARNTVLVHGVGLTNTDIDGIMACGAAVVWCPNSNVGMLGRTLDPRPLFDAGRLALGSDSRLTGAHDMLEELRVAAAHSDLTPAELLRLVTRDASRVLALPEVGGLDPGQHADLVIVRAGDADPHRALLGLRRGDIRAVVREGVPAVADPDFDEWFAICGVPTTRITLDDRPKLIATALLGPPGAAALEPGLRHG